MPVVIVTTVGTSSLEKEYLESQRGTAFYAWTLREERSFEANSEHVEKLADLISEAYSNRESLQWLPAEIASLSALLEQYKEEISVGDGSRFIFISSRTKKGAASARAVVKAFRQIFGLCSSEALENGECSQIQIRPLEGLQRPEAGSFEKAVEGLNAVMSEEVRLNAGFTRLFNFTGSYKAIIPYATEYCNVHGFRMAYLYELSETIIFKDANTRKSVEVPAIPYQPPRPRL